MSLNLVVPELESKPANSKDAVISVLAEEWPLTLKGIFYKVKKKYHYGATYQALFKAVKELLEEGVLLEKEKRYEINIEWVKKLQSFTDIIETNYYAKERIHSFSGITESNKNEDILVLNFESIFDAEKYLYYFMKSVLFKTKGDDIFYCTNNEWRPIFYLRAEYNYYRRLQKRGHRFHILCSGNSYMEKICAEFYKSIGANFVFTKEKFSTDSLVFGDYFISIFIPETLKADIKSMLSGKKIKSLIGVLENKSTIRVVITKDKALAESFKKQNLKNFGK